MLRTVKKVPERREPRTLVQKMFQGLPVNGSDKTGLYGDYTDHKAVRINCAERGYGLIIIVNP